MWEIAMIRIGWSCRYATNQYFQTIEFLADFELAIMDEFVRRLICISWFFLLLSVPVSPLVAANASDNPEIILSASEINYPPFCVTGSNHKVDSFSVELLRAALRGMGREVSFDVDIWTTVKQSLIEKKSKCCRLLAAPLSEKVFLILRFPIWPCTALLSYS